MTAFHIDFGPELPRSLAGETPPIEIDWPSLYVVAREKGLGPHYVTLRVGSYKAPSEDLDVVGLLGDLVALSSNGSHDGIHNIMFGGYTIVIIKRDGDRITFQDRIPEKGGAVGAELGTVSASEFESVLLGAISSVWHVLNG